MVALAPAVAVDAAVRTTAVYVHTVVSALVMEYSLCFFEVHAIIITNGSEPIDNHPCPN
jgi:hypothetical protein